MLYRIAALTLLTVTTAASDVWPNRDPDALVVHEWGTFTSIAGTGGDAIAWLPLQAANDLPCFVDRFRHFRPKSSVRGTIRMETPVLYFYAPREMTVDVSVRFANGLITEWFPRAEVTPAETLAEDALKKRGFAGTASWSRVRVLPGIREDFPTEGRSSHYYLARQTDAAPVEAAGATEKFLFYRGVADVRVPVSAVAGTDGSVRVTGAGAAPLGTVVLFERRGDQIGFEVQDAGDASTTLNRPRLTGNLPALTAALERVLVQKGLYAREAAAMVNTWRDSWFEEGSRVLYVVPEATIDAMLPLDIKPRPGGVVRVFVGRMEVITPATRAAVEQALAARDAASLQKYGRFLLPIAERILADPAVSIDRTQILQFIYGSLAAATRSPVCPAPQR